MRVRQTTTNAGSTIGVTGSPRRRDITWRLRRSPLARSVLGSVVKACVVMLAVVAAVTGFFVWAFGHPVAWSVIGVLFAVLPLAGLILAVGVGLRAATAAGPGWLAVRFFGRWRVVDLGQVRAVRLVDGGSFPGFGGGASRAFGSFGGPGGAGPSGFGLGGFGRPGPGPGSAGPGGAGTQNGGTLVFEDPYGGRVQISVDGLDGLEDMVRGGLAPDAVIDVDAARVLERGSTAAGSGTIALGPSSSDADDDARAGAPEREPEQETGDRP